MSYEYTATNNEWGIEARVTLNTKTHAYSVILVDLDENQEVARDVGYTSIERAKQRADSLVRVF